MRTAHQNLHSLTKTQPPVNAPWRLHIQRCLIAVLLGSLCSLVASRSHAGLPEPGITLYGKVYQDGFLATSGDLTWTYASAQAGTVFVTTKLGRLRRPDGDEYSYVVTLLADRALPGRPPAPNSLSFNPTDVPYTRAATLNGLPISLANPSQFNTTVSVASRGASERVDLVLSGDVPTLPGAPSNPSPIALAVNVPVGTALDWDDLPPPIVYDVFLWKTGVPRPDVPVAEGILVSSFQPPAPLDKLTDYSWQVRARNGAGPTLGETWSFVTVPAAPVFIAQPANMTVNAGRSAGFSATADGFGTVLYQWQKNMGDINASTSMVHLISNASAGDAGQYRAAATNAGGTTFSNEATLTVLDPPQANNASVFLQQIPTRIVGGTYWNFRVGFRNESPVSWSTLQGFSLAVLVDEANFFNGATQFEFPDPQAVIAPSGGMVSYLWGVYVPREHPVGIFRLHLRMQEEGVETFGESVDMQIEIPNSALDWQLYE